MPIRRVLVSALLLAGCSSTHPAVLSGRASAGGLGCALAEATAAGYSVKAAEDGVFFNAELLRHDDDVDALNVSLVEGTLRVLATTATNGPNGPSSQAPSRRVRADAARIAARCVATS